VAFDLLGFGASPKPEWLSYNIDDHARAVIASLAKLRLSQPAIVVGHSMGCLVAVRVARLRPDLVQHLVLYEMPLYTGLPQKRRYRLRTNLYFKLYKQLMEYQPEFNAANVRRLKHFKQKIVGFEVTPESWLPFVRSLGNVIMKQSAAEDIKRLDMPMDVIYGRFDMLVIRGKPKQFFGDRSDHITAHTIKVRHTISKSASLFLLQRIEAALAGRATRHPAKTDNMVG
jgi:pimeloyl-ACP methyl ester carboxylesterase